MNYRCLVLDDEPLARELLSGYIQQLPSLSLVASCPDALTGLQVLHAEPVDLLFIDIKMPQLSGIDLVRTLTKPPALILTTAFPEYALEGFEVGAVDYLLKPFSFTRFVQAVHRVLDRARPIEASSPAVAPLTSCLFLKVDRKIVKVFLAEVLYWQAYGNYVKVFLQSGRTLLVSETLGHIEKLLPAAQFIRTHKSYVISLGDITEYRTGAVSIGAVSLPIGDMYRKQFLDAIG
jgi:DNA-binding LytR/AlgR family response regulator